MLGQSEILAVVDGDLDDGRSIDLEGSGQGRHEVGGRLGSEAGDAEACGKGDEVGVAEVESLMKGEASGRVQR